jgi:hypothetical protein
MGIVKYMFYKTLRMLGGSAKEKNTPGIYMISPWQRCLNFMGEYCLIK